MMTIHKVTAGDGYTYLTKHIAGGDVQRARGQEASDYYTAKGNPVGYLDRSWCSRPGPRREAGNRRAHAASVRSGNASERHCDHR